jgi:hypothetical protein
MVRAEDTAAVDTIHSFFERLLLNWDYTPLGGSFTKWDNDVLHFFGHECLVGFVAIAMQERRFSIAADVLSMPLFKPRNHEQTGEAATYSKFRPYLESLESRNQQLKLNRLSLHADVISEHHEHSVVPFSSFMEADVTLYARGLIATKFPWYPVSAVFLGRSFGSLPTYVRATSKRFYDRLKPLLFNREPDVLRSELTAALTASKGIQFDYREVSVAQLLNLEGLGTAP